MSTATTARPVNQNAFWDRWKTRLDTLHDPKAVVTVIGGRNVATSYQPLPIGIRTSDWLAVVIDDENLWGHGATEHEAIEALRSRMEELDLIPEPEPVIKALPVARTISRPIATATRVLFDAATPPKAPRSFGQGLAKPLTARQEARRLKIERDRENDAHNLGYQLGLTGVDAKHPRINDDPDTIDDALHMEIVAFYQGLEQGYAAKGRRDRAEIIARGGIPRGLEVGK